MLKRIWNVILSLFRRRKRQEQEEKTPFVEIDRSDTEAPESTDAVPEGSADAGVPALTGDDRRIALLTSGLKPYRRRMPEVRRVEVDGFTDAYRFWLRLCGRHSFSCKCSGGHVRYNATTGGKPGTMELTDKTGSSDTVAVLRIGGTASGGQVREIRFIVSNKKTD